jgi:hypothetical protein
MEVEFFLTDDLNETGTVQIGLGATVKVNLNGKTIHIARTANSQPVRILFDVASGGSLEVHDGRLEGEMPLMAGLQAEDWPTANKIGTFMDVQHGGEATITNVEFANNVALVTWGAAVTNSGVVKFRGCRFRSLHSKGHTGCGAILSSGTLFITPTGNPAGDFVDCGGEELPVLSLGTGQIFLEPVGNEEQTKAAWLSWRAHINEGAKVFFSPPQPWQLASLNNPV